MSGEYNDIDIILDEELDTDIELDAPVVRIAYSAVVSVNGKVGVVVLTASDVGAQPTLGFTPENVANKSSTIDSDTTKYPTNAAVRNFVNSSIATNTANYISNNGEPFTSLAQLQAYSGTVTNNDYAFITGTDEHGNTYFDRYKATVSGTTVAWAKEYRLNNSSFTTAQWAAISSGITAQLVLSYSNHIANTSLHLADGDRAKIDNAYQLPIGGIPKTDMAAGVQESLGKADTALQNHQSLDAYRTSADQDTIDRGKQPMIDNSHKLSADLIANGSTNKAYTGTEKTKLAGIEEGATAVTENTVTGWGFIKSAVVPLSSTLAWGAETHAGSLTPDLTLPDVPASPTIALEIVYIFTALSANADFAPPSAYILGDEEDGFAGMDPGDTISYTNLTIGSIYEISFKVLDSTHISLIKKEHKTA